MAVKEKIKSHPNVVDYFKALPFKDRHIEKPRVKRLKNIYLLSELPFYHLGYSHKIELVEKKDPIELLEASESSIKDLFNIF